MPVLILLVGVILLLILLVQYKAACSVYRFGLVRATDDKDIEKIMKPAKYGDSPHRVAAEKAKAYLADCPHEDLYTTSFDDLKLHAFFYPCKEDQKKYVIWCHGFKSHAMRESAPYIEFYHSMGYHCVIVDMRAHGESEGETLGLGVKDRFDVISWADFLVDSYGEDISILLHGVSMGSAAVLSATGEPTLPKQVKGVTADCGYTSIAEMLSLNLSSSAASVFIKPVIFLCERMCKRRLGFDFHHDSPLELVANSKTPTLIIHGNKDDIVPSSMAQKLYNSCSAPKDMLIVKNAAHGQSIAVDPVRYHEKMMLFHHMIDTVDDNDI